MKIYLFAFIVFFLCSACPAQEDVTIEAIISGKTFTKTVPADAKEFMFGAIHADFQKISGLESLKKLERIKLGPGINELSFLSSVPNLEYLICDSTGVTDFDFLEYLPDLIVLYVNIARLYQNKTVLDLKNNEKIKYIALHNLHNEEGNTYFNFIIKNIPKSVEYINLSRNEFIIFSEKLVNKIANVTKLIIDNKTYQKNRKLFRDIDIILEHDDERFPEEYRSKIIARNLKYSIK